jgi:hypothetical protein
MECIDGHQIGGKGSVDVVLFGRTRVPVWADLAGR